MKIEKRRPLLLELSLYQKKKKKKKKWRTKVRKQYFIKLL